jgi:hypothetical protein
MPRTEELAALDEAIRRTSQQSNGYHRTFIERKFAMKSIIACEPTPEQIIAKAEKKAQYAEAKARRLEASEAEKGRNAIAELLKKLSSEGAA